MLLDVRIGMTRIALLIFMVLNTFGCNQYAQSQQQPVEQAGSASSETVTSPPDSTAVDRLNEKIYQSRHTAITQAVQSVAPAVVSVNVLEVQQVRYRDPFADFFSDPYFERFFGRRRSQVIERQVQNLGSGFVISPDGYIVTNDHVAGSATKITVAFPSGKTLEADLIGTDPTSDVSLIKVTPEEPLRYLEFCTESEPIVGEWVIALGNPFGLFEAAEPSVTVGVVSATGRSLQSTQSSAVYRDMIQTDASINRGNSGGPLVNALGQVIGVNTAIISQSGGSVGLGFAVPAERVIRIIDELRAHGSIDRSYYTGLRGRDVNQNIAQVLGLDEARGILVQDIDPDSPAENADFRPYDIIVSFQGQPVNNRNDFLAYLTDYRPGDRVMIGILRDGRDREVTMEIGRQP